MEIELKDLKFQYKKDMQSMQDKVAHERKRRMNIYEEKLDKNNQIL